MVELSSRTLAHVHTLFRSSDVALAERALISDCGDNLPLLSQAGAEDLERVRFAALRLSGGRLDDLAKAIELAQTDWRDLLVAADFADDVQAHTRWAPRRFDGDVVNRWMAGGSLPGVAYSLNQPIVVLSASDPQRPGCVIGLEGLEPEPRYLVELSTGHDIQVFQRHLARAK